MEPVGQGHVALELPSVAYIRLETVVGSESTAGVPECFLRGREADAISQKNPVGRVRRGIRLTRRRESGSDLRVSKESRQPSALNVIESRALADDVCSKDSAAVVLDFVIGLNRRLRRQQIRPAAIRTAAA